MSFVNPWGLLALLALPAILIIHLYQRRFPSLVVAGLHLWPQDAQVRMPGRRRHRLPITATLLLELLTALLLALALSGPRLGGGRAAEHLVVVLDNSASMSAVVPAASPAAADSAVERSFRDSAVEYLRRRAEQLGGDARYTLLLSGRRPVMLAGPAVTWDEADAALERWNPAAGRHSFQPAWDQAAQLAEDSGRLLFMSDRLPPSESAAPAGMEFVAFGREAGNVAITAAGWTPGEDGADGRVRVRVENLGRSAAPVEVAVRSADGSGRRSKGGRDAEPRADAGRIGNPSYEIYRQTVYMPAGGRRLLEADVPAGAGQLTISASSPADALDIDSRLVLVEPVPVSVRVAVTLPEKSIERRHVVRALQAVESVELVGLEKAHLVIGPAERLPAGGRRQTAGDDPEAYASGSQAGAAWRFIVGPLEAASTPDAQSIRDAAIPGDTPFLIEKQHPLLAGVVLGGVRWAGVRKLTVPATPLISAGGHVLLGALGTAGSPTYVLNIDLAASNLAESPDWPILINNLVELRRRGLPPEHRNFPTGVPFRLALPVETAEGASHRELTLHGPSGERKLTGFGIVEVPPLSQPGVYEIRDKEQTLIRFAANFFDREESTLTGLESGTRPPARPEQRGSFRLDEPFGWLLAAAVTAACVLLLFNWRTLRK